MERGHQSALDELTQLVYNELFNGIASVSEQTEFNETTTLFNGLFLVFFRQRFSSNLRHVRHCDVSTATPVEKANQRWRRHL